MFCVTDTPPADGRVVEPTDTGTWVPTLIEAGMLSVAITLGAVRPAHGFGRLAFFIGASLAALANAALVWLAYRFADRLIEWMGATARLVIVRLSAFLLVCIGVQILLTGIGDLVQRWRGV